MNEMQVTDPFHLAPMDDMFRGVMRPWLSRRIQIG